LQKNTYKKIGYYKIKYLSNNLSEYNNVFDLDLCLRDFRTNINYLYSMIMKLKIFKLIN